MDHHALVERRINLRLMSYWERLRKDRPMPTEADIDPEDIKDLWDSCLLVHVKDLDKSDYNYVYLGDAILEAYRSGLDIDDVHGIITPHAERNTSGFSSVISTCKPLLEEGEFQNLYGDTVKFRQCLLPLGSGNKVEAIFGGMHFKIFPKK